MSDREQVSVAGRFRTLPGAPVKMWQGKDSASYGVFITFTVNQWFNAETKEWTDYPAGKEQDVEAIVCLAQRNGADNERGQEAMLGVLGWDGELRTIESLKTPACQVKVEPDTYKGELSYKVAWINPYDGDGNAGSKEVDLEALMARYQSGLRAKAAARKAKDDIPY